MKPISFSTLRFYTYFRKPYVTDSLCFFLFFIITLCCLTIGFIDDFAKNITEPTVIILDNATIHHSQEFEEQIERWQEQDLFLFYLPRYSPHLNIIETLWRKIKYEWLKPHHYFCSNSFFAHLEIILLNIGTIFKINFDEYFYPIN